MPTLWPSLRALPAAGRADLLLHVLPADGVLRPVAARACAGLEGLAVKIKPTPDRGPARSHSEEYEAYLSSPAWRETRALALQRAGGLCEAPGCDAAATDVHHRSYSRLGAEPLADLVALCPACHLAADVRRAQTIALSRRLRAVRDDVRGGR
jgi:5-methylcytosine-specific restriction endonuclease McrA